tara:strand:- start:100 stop:525 length:426 start_codon:yes stop_codon:yes gene_type:complete
MIVSIKQDLITILNYAALSAAPLEACGLLLGEITDQVSVADCIITDNVTLGDKTQNFEIDPAVHLKLQRESRVGCRQILGVWHSHPNGMANLSEADKQQSVEQGWLWLITAVGLTVPETVAFIASSTDCHTFSKASLSVSL